MLVTIQHIKSVTVADGTNTDLQRPSDWNSNHAATIQFTNTDLVQWFSAGTSSISSGTLIFGNSNNVSFGMSNGTITASFAGLTISALGSQQAGGTIVFSNSNFVSFGMNGSTVTATWSNPYNLSIAANGSTVGSSTISFANSNGISFGLTNSTMTASIAVPAISASGSSQNSGTIVFSNSNNVTFGMNGSTITATASFSASLAISAAGASQNVGTIVFSSSTNANITFGMAGSTITATYNDLDTRRNIVFSGYDLVMGQTTTAYNTAATSSSRPWIAMPVTLLTSQALSGFLMTAGVSATSSGAAATNSGTLSMGIYSSSAGTLSQVWTSSVAFSERVSSSSISISFGGGASSLSTSTVSGSTSVLYRISIPLTLTLQSGTYYFGVMDQMVAPGASLVEGVWSNPLPLTSGLILGSSVTSAISDPTGVISSSITAVASALFPLSLTVASAGPNTISKYPMALVC